MTTETQSFPTRAVLSAITGRLVTDIGEVYEVLNFMTGESLFTHQLPRVSREAGPAVLSLHPELSAAFDEAENEVNRDNWREWRATWERRYGAEITVPKMDRNQHERIDPMSELAEKIHPSRIIAAKV